MMSGFQSTSNNVAGGMYGGRPEYSNGRPNHGIINGRFPFDLGFLPGKGYEPNIHVPLPKYALTKYTSTLKYPL